MSKLVYTHAGTSVEAVGYIFAHRVFYMGKKPLDYKKKVKIS